MLLQFIEFGIYKRNKRTAPHPIVYDVIVGGRVVATCPSLSMARVKLYDRLEKG